MSACGPSSSGWQHEIVAERYDMSAAVEPSARYSLPSIAPSTYASTTNTATRHQPRMGPNVSEPLMTCRNIFNRRPNRDRDRDFCPASIGWGTPGTGTAAPRRTLFGCARRSGYCLVGILSLRARRGRQKSRVRDYPGTRHRKSRQRSLPSWSQKARASKYSLTQAQHCRHFDVQARKASQPAVSGRPLRQKKLLTFAGVGPWIAIQMVILAPSYPVCGASNASNGGCPRPANPGASLDQETKWQSGSCRFDSDWLHHRIIKFLRFPCGAGSARTIHG
jgi:hypothetical protein